jgi:general secretion pathway protein C
MVKRYFTFLHILLLGILIYFSINTFYKITTARLVQPEPVLGGSSKVSLPMEEKSPLLSNYNPIIDRNLFKTKAKADFKPGAVNVDALKQTNLKLKLWGTVIGHDEQTYAVIEEENTRKQNLYRVGDTVQNAIVKMVIREKVVLNVNSKDEILEIEKVPKSFRAAQPIYGRQTATTPKKVRSQRITLRRSQIENAVEDINKLMTQVNIRPHYANGRPDGLLLTRIKPRSIFLRMGLRNGDIITGVNETPIASADDILRFYENLKSADRVSLQLKRRGRSRNIDYTIK